jgi:secondary thiamine-phosphate synthase enzyme
MIKKWSLQTSKRDEMIEITRDVHQFITETKIQEGIAIIYCPHTTAGITINENADPDVKRDMLRRFDEIHPWKHTLDLHDEGNSAAHMKASTIGSSQQVIIHGGSMILGTWQGIYFCEFDGPRTRDVYVKVLEG